jgi:hypothetical protein
MAKEAPTKKLRFFLNVLSSSFSTVLLTQYWLHIVIQSEQLDALKHNGVVFQSAVLRRP